MRDSEAASRCAILLRRRSLLIRSPALAAGNSFHGVLSGPGALLAALIVLSTLTTGWHYLSDVVAGALVAMVSCALAKGYSRVEASFARLGGASG